MHYQAGMTMAAGWLLTLTVSSTGWPQEGAPEAGAAEANASDDEWVSAPGSFASSFSYFDMLPYRPYSAPLVMAAPNRGAPPALPRVNDRPRRAVPMWPIVRRPAPQPEPRGFGVLADDDNDDDQEEPAPRPIVRPANAAATARARQFVAFGDERFREQDFSLAYQRYKKAAQSAPDLADAYFRQGLAQIALGHYPSAAAAIKRGLAFQPRWPGSDFRLDQLYGDNRLAKTNHLERLADAAANDADNADLLFLVGIELHFDGQAARARPFFERAADLGQDAGWLKGFLQTEARPIRHRAEEL